MKINISDNLKSLRTMYGNTQGQLSVFLGVTPQAVSKWERGEAMPDISLLPDIASFYQVSVDRILGVEQYHTQERLDNYKKEDITLMDEKQHTERVKLWRKAVKEMPNRTDVLHHLVFALRSENEQDNADEIIVNSKEILKKTAESGEYFGAIGNICRAYKAKGDMESAKHYATKAGRYIGTENQLMIRILEGERATEYAQWNIETLMDLIADNAGVMLEKGVFTLEEKESICKTVLKLFHLICGNEYGFYHCRASSWHLRLAEYLLQANRNNEALNELELAAMHAKKFDTQKEMQYKSAILNRQCYRKQVSESKYTSKLIKKMSGNQFADIAVTTRFQRIMSNLSGVSQKGSEFH